MNEIERLLQAYTEGKDSPQKFALATLVKLYGSSYRRPGARMLMQEDGHWTGAISGGCLEGDALRKARAAILAESPRLEIYDTINNQDAKSIGAALGCNGIVEVLIEPLPKAKDAFAIRLLQKSQEQNQAYAIASIFRSSEGFSSELCHRMGLGEDQALLSNVENPLLSACIEEDLRLSLRQKKSLNRVYQIEGEEIEVFFEYIPPILHLWVFGGGYDAVPVSQSAKQLGWKVSVGDDCPAHLGPKRFPQADEVVFASRENGLDKISLHERSAAVLMSHNYAYDLAILKQLLNSSIAYIGILGPYKRFEKMQEDLRKEGIHLKEADFERIHSPVGLDLGAETPEEIALSIVAEIQARFAKKRGGFLKDKPGFIHERPSQESVHFSEVHED